MSYFKFKTVATELPGAYLSSPAGPAPPAAQPTAAFPPVVFLPSHRSSSVASADAALATSCLPPRRPRRVWIWPVAPLCLFPRSQLSLSTPSPSSALSLAQPERSSSPPFAIAAATSHPMPRRRAKKLHQDALVLLNVSRDQKDPEQPPSSSSSSFGPGALLRRFGHSDASPSSLTIPTVPL